MARPAPQRLKGGVPAAASRVAIDPVLLHQAQAVSGAPTKRAVVTQALQAFIALRQQRAVLALLGTLEWDADFDVKAERLRQSRR